MKKVKSPTRCIHAVAGGSDKDGWVTACNHRDYNRWNGYEHQWPLTYKEVTCKRCLAVMINEQGPCYTEEVMYQWPASQICEDCGYAYKVLNYSTDEDFVLCNKKCKLNNGRTCPEKKHEG